MAFCPVGYSEAKLAQSLDSGFWSPALCPERHRFQRSNSRVRLAPIDSVASNMPSSAERTEYLPSPVARAPSVGHVGTLWGLRHSAPSSFLSSMSPIPGMRRMAELATSSLSCSDVEPSNADLRRTHKDVRSRRMRRPADFGCSRLRSHSSAGCASEAGTLLSSQGVQQVDAGLHISSAAPSKCPSTAVSRGSSTPPTGTTKADDAAGAAAKARAVAALQHLFFEEMQKNGQDANEAAARALLRLSEVPTSQTARSTTPSSEAASPLTPHSSSCDEEAPDAVEEAPAKPLPTQSAKHIVASVSSTSEPVLPRRPAASVEGRRKRPCHAPRIKVGA